MSQPITEILTLNELAALLRRSPQTILNDRVRAPGRVPPAIRPPGTAKLLWRRSDVLAWLTRHTEPDGPEPPAAAVRRRGRPTKAEAAKAAAAARRRP